MPESGIVKLAVEEQSEPAHCCQIEVEPEPPKEPWYQDIKNYLDR
jgi:hypothetical protein